MFVWILRRLLVPIMVLCPTTNPVQQVLGVALLTAVLKSATKRSNVSFADGHRKKMRELCAAWNHGNLQ